MEARSFGGALCVRITSDKPNRCSDLKLSDETARDTNILTHKLHNQNKRKNEYAGIDRKHACKCILLI